MTQVVKEVIYWKGRAGLRLDLVISLTARGCAIRGVSSFDELSFVIKTHLPVLLVVDATGGSDELDARLIELEGCKTLEHTPTLLFGLQAVKRSLSLSRRAPHLHAFDVPYSLSRVAEKCEVLLGSSDFVDPTEQAQPPTYSNPRRLKEAYVPPVSPITAASLEAEALEADKLLADHPNSAELQRALNEIASMGERVAEQAKQVAMLAGAIAEEFDLSPERANNIKTASLCLNWGLAEKAPEFADCDLSQLESAEELKTLSSGFKQSAALIREHLNDDLAARTVGLIADLVGRHEIFEDDDVIYDAHCALITELAQRSCWSSGDWNPGGAQRFLARMRKKRLMGGLPLNKKIQKKIAGVIGEKIAERCGRQRQLKFGQRSAKRGARETAEVMEALRKAEQHFSSDNLHEVGLAEVEAGMKLARPVIAHDGRLILEAGVTFNEELVWRLWELASIRPIWPKLTIVRDSIVDKVDRVLSAKHAGKTSQETLRTAQPH